MLLPKIDHNNMIVMRKTLTICILFIGLFNFTYGQAGVNTSSPTESIDDNGTMRIRVLPTKSTSDSYPVASSTQNVIGKTTKANLVPNNATANFTADDNSTAMFVIKRYKISDYPSNGNGFDTQMSSDKWEAFLSNVGFSFAEINAIQNVFNQLHLHSWQLSVNQSIKKWVIWGDINGVKEKSDFVDVLFIRKKVVAAEDRTNLFPF